MTRFGSVNSNEEVVISYGSLYPPLTLIRAQSIDGTGIFSPTNFMGTVVEDLALFPSLVIVKVVSITGFVSVPTISIGTNSTSYDNILPSTALTGLDTTDEYIQIVLASSPKLTIPSLTDIYVKVVVGAVATALQLDVNLIGYYL